MKIGSGITIKFGSWNPPDNGSGTTEHPFSFLTFIVEILNLASYANSGKYKCYAQALKETLKLYKLDNLLQFKIQKRGIPAAVCGTNWVQED